MQTSKSFMMTGEDPAGPSPMRGQEPKSARLGLILILFLGFGLRAAGLVWGQAFCYGSQGDCLDAYRVAVNYAKGEPRAQYIGQPNFNGTSKLPGPLWAMFCATGLRLWGSVEGVVWVIILLNTAAIYLTYLLAARTLGYSAALWAALLMATSPAAIQFSVVLFNPVVMSFLGACLFLALWQVTRRDRSRAAFWLLFLPLLTLHFHMSGLMLIPAILLVLVLNPRRLSVPWLVGGVVAGSALYLPYLSGEMAHGWENTRGMLSASPRGYSLEAFKIFTAPPGFLINYWDSRWTFQRDEYQEIGRACFGSFSLLIAFNVLSAILAGMFVLGAFAEGRVALRGLWRSPRVAFARSPGMVFLTITFVVPLLISLVEGKRFHGRYCLVLLAPLFSLAAAAVVRWLSREGLRTLFVPLLLVTLGANVWLVLAIFRYQGNAIDQGPLFLSGFRNLETVYQSLKHHADRNHLIRVEADQFQENEYMRVMDVTSHWAGSYPLQICTYVDIREHETSLLTPGRAPVATYKILLADHVPPGDPAVAYRGHGLAVLLVSAKP